MLQAFVFIQEEVGAMGKLLAAAGFNGLCGVGFGAWSAHGAAGLIGPAATEWVKTGAQYQLWHAAALLALLGLPAAWARIRNLAGSCFCVGALLFSGSLYVLALAGWRGAAFVTPFGGLLMLLGWLLLLGYGLKTWRNQP
jgi:uncharacterized membrane protein YgdD (TMEM256/DUF423 family)